MAEKKLHSDWILQQQAKNKCVRKSMDRGGDKIDFMIRILIIAIIIIVI
jgi:hypothetical protein